MKRQRNTIWLRALSLTAALALFGAACGDDDGGDSADNETDAVEAPEGRDDQDPGFDDLRADDDFGAGGEDEGADDEESTDDEGATDDEEASDDEESTDDESGDDGEELPDEYEDYVSIEDDSGDLTLSVPEEWGDVVTDAPFVDAEGNESGVGIAAAPDLDAFAEFFDAPGVVFAAETYDGVIPEDEMITQLLESNSGVYADGCTFDDSYEYEDGFYEGAFDIYENCGDDEDAGAVVLVALSPDSEYFIVVTGQVLGDADLTAIDEIIVSSLYTP